MVLGFQPGSGVLFRHLSRSDFRTLKDRYRSVSSEGGLGECIGQGSTGQQNQYGVCVHAHVCVCM